MIRPTRTWRVAAVFAAATLVLTACGSDSDSDSKSKSDSGGSKAAAKGDGTLTTDDITGREKKVFAMLDRNNDGKIERNELPKNDRMGRHRQWDGSDDSME